LPLLPLPLFPYFLRCLLFVLFLHHTHTHTHTYIYMQLYIVYCI
jgi:hypothetical protein